MIGAIAKPVGFVGILLGSVIGGTLMSRLGTFRALWVFGLFQGMATFFFALLVFTGPNPFALAAVLLLDNIAIGMGSIALATFMMNLCDKSFTATQYALFTSLMAVSINFLGAASGYLAEALGWVAFFAVCCLFATPGLLLLLRYPKWEISP